MEVSHIVAARKEHLLGKRQSLATEEGPKKKPRILLSAEEKVAHSWVAACDAGDIRMVEQLLHVAENTVLGINCADGAGVTGLMAALEKGRLEVVDKLLDHKDINTDFTQTDSRGRSALDLVILSPSVHFMDVVLEGLAANLVKDEELEKVLLPRLLSCVNLGKVNKFQRMLDFFDVNFKEGALLSFLIVSGEAKFIRILADYCKGRDVIITELNRRSFLYALRTGRSNVVEPLRHIPTFAVKEQVFLMLVSMIEQSSRQPIKLDIFETGINCIDVNVTGFIGFTLLMMAVMRARPLYVKLLMAKKSLKVNLTNADGYSALDYLNTNYASYGQLVNCFLERQAVFKDIDFSKIKMPLLLTTLNMNRLDLASSLLDCSSYYASSSELATARLILAQGKRVLLFHPKEDSADKKKMLLKLLYKVKTRRGQKAT